MEAAALRTAVMAAQAVLSARDPSLIIDGKWGAFTQSAFNRAPTTTQAQVDSVLKALGVTVGELTAERSKQRLIEEAVETAEGERWISASEAQALVRRAAAKQGLAPHASALESFLDREAVQKQMNGVKFYDTRSQNATSFGLMQMQGPAWTAARKYDQSIGDFVANRFDARANIAAGVAYARYTIKALEERRLPVTEETLYLGHNQGSGLFTGMVTNFDGQSAVVRGLIKKFLTDFSIRPRFQDDKHRKW